MDAIIVLLGLIVGIAIFFFIMSRITAVVYNIKSVAFTFFISWGIGIVIAWIAWKIAIIIGIIALILYLWSKLFGKKSAATDSNEQTEQSKGENNE